MIDNLSKYGVGVPLKNKAAETVTNAFSIITRKCNREPSLIESEDGRKYIKRFVAEFLYSKDVKRYKSDTKRTAVFAERFHRTIRDLVKEPVFEKVNAKWVDELPEVPQKYKKNIHSSTKTTPLQATIKSNQIELYNNIRNRREKKTNVKIDELVRTFKLRETFYKGDTTKRSYDFYTKTKEIDDVLPSCYLKFFPENFIIALFTHNENNSKKTKYKLNKIRKGDNEKMF